MNTLIMDIITLLISISLILYFRFRDKKNSQLKVLKSFIQTTMDNIYRAFQEREKELRDKTINLEISLKKVDKASEFINKRLGDFKAFIDEAGEIQKGLGDNLQSAYTFNQDIVKVRSDIEAMQGLAGNLKALGKSLEEDRKYASMLKNEIEQSRIWAQDNIGEFVKRVESNLGVFKNQLTDDLTKRMEKTEKDIFGRSDAVNAAIAKLENFDADTGQKIVAMEKYLTETLNTMSKGIVAKYDGVISSLKTDLDSTSKEFESKRGVFTNKYDILHKELESLEKRIMAEASDVYTQVNTAVMREIDEMKKGVSENAEKRLSTIDDRIKDELKRFEEGVNGNIRNFNEKLNVTAKTINELNNKLSHFVTENTDKFKLELTTLKASYTSDANALMKDLRDKETSMTNLYKTIQEQIVGASETIKDAGRNTTEGVLSKIKQMEEETVKRLASSASDITGRMKQLDNTVNSFENTINLKVTTLQNKLDTQMTTYKSQVESLQGAAKKAEGDLSDSIVIKAKEIDAYMENLKASYQAEYQLMIDRAKDEIIAMNEEVGKMGNNIKHEKEDMQKNVTDSMTSLKTWSMTQIADIRDELDSAKLRTDSAVVGIQEDVEERITSYKSELEGKLKGSFSEIETGSKKLFENLEKEFYANIEKLKNNSVTDISKLNEKVAYITTLVDKQINVSDALKKDMTIFETNISKMKTGAETNYIELQEKYNQLMKNLGSVDQITDRAKKEAEESVREHFNTIHARMDSEKNGINSELASIRSNSKDYFEEIRGEIDKDYQQYQEFLNELHDRIDRLQDTLNEESRRIERQTQAEVEAEMEAFFSGERKEMGERIESFKSSFLPPSQEILDQFQSKIESATRSFDIKSNDMTRQIQDTLNNLTTEERKTTEQFESQLREFNDKMEEYYGSFNDKLEKQFTLAKSEFDHIKEKVDEFNKNYSDIENKSIKTIRDKANDLEKMVSDRIKSISGDLDGYIKTSESEVQNFITSMKAEVRTLSVDLEHMKEQTRESVLDDISTEPANERHRDAVRHDAEENFNAGTRRNACGKVR